MSLEPDPSVCPDFFLLDAEGHGFLIASCDLRTAELDDFIEPSLFAPHDRNLSARASDPAAGLTRVGRGITKISRALVFPSASGDRVANLRTKIPIPPDIHLLGADACTPQAFFPRLLKINAGNTLTREEQDSIRKELCPESAVPPAFRPRIASHRGLPQDSEGRSTQYLLDFDQEEWVKRDLVPPPSSASVGLATRSRLVTGPAGSGKSLVLLYRALLLSRYSRGKNLLFLTHNKALAGDLEARFNRISADSPYTAPGTTLTFAHFFRWCGKLSYDHSCRLIRTGERNELAHSLSNDFGSRKTFDPTFLIEEFAFIADQVDDSLESYLAAPRSGRLTPLDKRSRNIVHSLYRRYESTLRERGLTDWPFIVRRLWEKLKSGTLRTPRYDYILIDEAQFFAPLWFAILNSCLNQPAGEFILAADPTQGFLKRRASWASVGIDIRGRSTGLVQSYRSRPEIQQFARRFFESRMHELPEGTALPPGIEDPSAPASDPPRLLFHPSPQDGVTWAVAQVAKAMAKGLDPSMVLILHGDPRVLPILEASLAEKVGAKNVKQIDHRTRAAEAIALTSIGAATGLERPVVLLLGIDPLFEAEENPGLSPRAREELAEENTRKIYMALTRAGERLLISYSREKTRLALEGGMLDENLCSRGLAPS